MRVLVILGTSLAALTIPFVSLAPTWIGAAGPQDSQKSPGYDEGPNPRVTRLWTELGILPLDSTSQLDDPPGDTDPVDFAQGSNPEHANPSAIEGKPDNVVCENGVCRVVPSPIEQTSYETIQQAMADLARLNVSQYQLTDLDNQTLITCVLRQDQESKVVTARGEDELQAMANVITEIKRLPPRGSP